MVEPGSGTAAGPANATEEVKINAARRVNTNFIAWEPYCWWDLMKSSAEEYQSSQSHPFALKSSHALSDSRPRNVSQNNGWNSGKE